MRSSLSVTFVILASAFIFGCHTDAPFGLLQSTTGYSGNLILTTLTADPSSGPGLIAQFTSSGDFVQVLEDLFGSGNYGSGSVYVPPNIAIAAVEGVDSLHVIDMGTKQITTITHTGLSGTPLRQMTRDTVDGSLYVVEATAVTPQIEKFTSDYQRAGNPFINTTTAACILATPYGITFIPATRQIAVVNSAAVGKLLIYDKDGNCVSSITTSPFNTGTPSGIAYHSKSNRFIVVRAGDHTVWSVKLDGTLPVQIYLNSGVINTPRAVACDDNGYIYVSSTGTDTIEKLYYTGSGVATRATSGPLIGPGIYSQNVSSISVVP